MPGTGEKLKSRGKQRLSHGSREQRAHMQERGAGYEEKKGGRPGAKAVKAKPLA